MTGSSFTFSFSLMALLLAGVPASWWTLDFGPGRGVERVPSQSSQFCVFPTHSCLILATNSGRQLLVLCIFFCFFFSLLLAFALVFPSKIANAPNRGGSNLIPYEIQLQRLRPGCRPAIPMVQIEIPVLRRGNRVCCVYQFGDPIYIY